MWMHITCLYGCKSCCSWFWIGRIFLTCTTCIDACHFHFYWKKTKFRSHFIFLFPDMLAFLHCSRLYFTSVDLDTLFSHLMWYLSFSHLEKKKVLPSTWNSQFIDVVSKIQSAPIQELVLEIQFEWWMHKKRGSSCRWTTSRRNWQRSVLLLQR